MRPSAFRLAKTVSWRARMPQSSYYQENSTSPALDRARRQYLIPNIVTGTCIITFVAGIYAYTIKVVSQDEFEDVPIPDAPQQPAQPPNASVVRQGGPSP